MLLLNSCTKQREAEIQFGSVDEKLWVFFEQFEIEGKKRGVDIDIRNLGITGEISEIRDDYVAGTCTYSHRNPNHITIDLNFWNNSDDFSKEMIIFHELGHCYLYRDHLEGRLSNGACRSIMRSGLENCVDNYNRFTRNMYLDELFEN